MLAASNMAGSELFGKSIRGVQERVEFQYYTSREAERNSDVG